MSPPLLATSFRCYNSFPFYVQHQCQCGTYVIIFTFPSCVNIYYHENSIYVRWKAANHRCCCHHHHHCYRDTFHFSCANQIFWFSCLQIKHTTWNHNGEAYERAREHETIALKLYSSVYEVRSVGVCDTTPCLHHLELFSHSLSFSIHNRSRDCQNSYQIYIYRDNR